MLDTTNLAVIDTLWDWRPGTEMVSPAEDYLSDSTISYVVGGQRLSPGTLTQWMTGGEETSIVSSFDSYSSPAFKLLATLSRMQKTPPEKRYLRRWPTKSAFRDAERLVKNLPLHLIPLPVLSLADDGEVNFFWDTPLAQIDLGTFGRGVFSFYAHIKNNGGFGEDDVPISTGIPTSLDEILR